MTSGKKIGLSLLVVVLVAIIALVIVVLTFDWNRLKPTLNQRISAAIHRPFAIEGDLDLSWERPTDVDGWRGWVPWPHLHAEQIRVGSPEPVTDADLARLKALDLTLAPLSLLERRVTIPRIAISGGEATLVRRKDGSNNWTLDLGDTSSDADTAEAQPGWTVDIGDITFDPIALHYRDQTLDASVDATLTLLGQPIAFSELSGGAPAPDDGTGHRVAGYAFGWQASGTYRGQDIGGEGKLGSLIALRQPGAPYPLQADVTAGQTRVSVAGTLTDPLAPKRIDLDLTFAGQNLGDLYRVIGVTLPDTPPYSTRGHLTADLATQDALTFRYRDFDGQVGDSDIHGDLTYTLGKPRPSLTGEVVSRQLRFADLAPLIGADSSSDSPDETSKPQPEGKVLPVAEFKTEQWRAMDADVKFTAQRIEHGDSLPLEDLYTHVRLRDGEILLDPLRFGVAGGNLNTTLRLDGSQTPLAARIDLHIRRLLLSRLFPEVELMQNSRGELNGDATLSGRGNSVAALLGSSDGDLQMIVSDGVISRNLMELAGLNVGNYLVGKLFGDEQVRINCAATSLKVDDGLARTRFFVIDTENALIKIDGSINFSNERLDLNIEPESKGARVFTLRSPLYVHGTFANPSPGVDASSLLARGAVGAFLGTVAAPAAALLALVSPSAGQTTPCNDFLSQIQTQR
ncbi:AsmA family protein [Salinicola endophyticus]|uniref:AsmA family protein n=1 Tax=Salinicola endophyticus TaxID=1949083 RepID=A0ABY8FGD6_9GAMM|nr:AsmA family protein [Salinicola endophyticus]WFF41125.1 AsmA family protein [Salinicola endophyticus]